MDRAQLNALLESVARGALAPAAAAEALAAWPTGDLGFARVDLHRAARAGHPEVVFGEGKTAEWIAGILGRLHAAGQSAVATRVDATKAATVAAALPAVVYHAGARILHLPAPGAAVPPAHGHIAVICAGTSDLPVADEAAVMAELLGNKVVRFTDVGVAGLHRLLGELGRIREARVLVVVAGMEGALPSVIGGLVDKPVIAVPTSVGYGAHLGGLTPLMGMLTGCAAGVGVVNIDNGFGAAVLASRINQLGVAP